MRRLLFLVAAGVLACEDTPTQPDTAPSPGFIPFSTLVGESTSSRLFAEGVHVIKTFEDALSFSKQVNSSEALRLVEVVDFDTQMAVAVVRSARPTTNYLLTINRIVSDGSRIKIHAVEAGNIGGTTTIWPLQVVRIPKTELPIEVEFEYECQEGERCLFGLPG